MTTRNRAVPIALLALGLTLVAARGGARDTSQAPAPRATGPQEVEILGVAVDPRTQVPAMILQGKRDRRNLMMTIDPAQMVAISLPLRGVTPPRPLTHDLFLTLFGRLKVTLARVVITDLRDDVYYATVHLTSAGGEMTLDARPSDAIALAIRARVPVLVEDRVFDKGGLAQPAPRRQDI